MAEVLSTEPITSYVNSYSELLLNHPPTYKAPTRPTLYASHKRVVRHRSQALERALYGCSAAYIDCTFGWEDTIFSERIAGGFIVGLFRTLGIGDDMSVRLAPTSLDASNYTIGPTYHKGMDLVVQTRTDNPIPLMGIDVTLGGHSTVQEKRGSLGIHLATLTPVIVLPLQSSSRKNNLDYLTYQQGPALDCVLKEGQYRPFAGLSIQQRHRWISHLGSQILTGIDVCRYGLAHSKEKAITETPGYKVAQEKLDYVERKLDGGLNRLREEMSEAVQ